MSLSKSHSPFNCYQTSEDQSGQARGLKKCINEIIVKNKVASPRELGTGEGERKNMEKKEKGKKRIEGKTGNRAEG